MIPFNPWRALAQDWPGVKVYVRILPDVWALTTWPTGGNPYITLAHDLDGAQQRCSLTHEVGHLVAGAPCVAFDEANEERVVDWTARKLLPDMRDLGEKLRHDDVATVAEQLGVTIRVLAERLARLTDAERVILANALPTESRRALVAAQRGETIAPVPELPAARKKAASKAKTPR